MKFTGKTYKNQVLALDGNEYTDCSFIQCTLSYSGGKLPVLRGCKFDPPNVHFHEAAANTLALMRAMYHGGFKDYVEATFNDIRAYQGGGSVFH